MNTLLRILAVALALLGTSCAPANPAARAQKRPAAFQGLPAEHRQMALEGKIIEGMNRDAVWVAWGPASRIYEASSQGVAQEIWHYTGLQPVYSSTLGIGVGLGYGHGGGYGRCRHADPFSYYDLNYGPQYVPFTQAEVKFQKGIVKSWERMKE